MCVPFMQLRISKTQVGLRWGAYSALKAGSAQHDGVPEDLPGGQVVSQQNTAEIRGGFSEIK